MRVCRCGLAASESAWARGGRACPECDAVWPENLRPVEAVATRLGALLEFPDDNPGPVATIDLAAIARIGPSADWPGNTLCTASGGVVLVVPVTYGEMREHLLAWKAEAG